jgi:excisionase family DNA binding protein
METPQGEINRDNPVTHTGVEGGMEKLKEPLIDIDELARRLNVSKSWVYAQTRLRKRNGFPVEKYGKYLRFDYEAVRQWARENG